MKNTQNQDDRPGQNQDAAANEEDMPPPLDTAT
jgi:hypothetical protein